MYPFSAIAGVEKSAPYFSRNAPAILFSHLPLTESTNVNLTSFINDKCKSISAEFVFQKWRDSSSALTRIASA
jgi:hypothetical protein